MTSNFADRTTTARHPAPPARHHFGMRFSSTPRGARLARRLCGERLAAWGVPYGADAHERLTLIAAELCANAVRHGHVPGRDFRMDLSAEPEGGAGAGRLSVRVAVTDTRGDRLPVPAPVDPPSDRIGGRGLLLVAALADRWGWAPRADGPGKTVWAVCEITDPNRPTPGG
ncbi:ATP-binding protein [Streptomyces sp. TP-A0874]|uniref:ATP-binding protein n=1 Tax=Streptomyces sp. TP-A0874 TaxID=549819 RepID=UPI0009A08BC9|nr:ATP-binding protein [Streptomyces sp. TP-A0874]